jgi:hypothetical protein
MGSAGKPKRREVDVKILRAYLACVWATAVLLARRQLGLPTHNVGRELAFVDGTTSRVYRETVRSGAPTPRPTLLVVQFQLRLVGRSRLLHSLFRAESILNTPLFAGFPGFRSKLWVTDEWTGVYRGVYEWDGADRAAEYADAITALLRLLSVPGSVGSHVVPGIRRDDFLSDPGIVGDAPEHSQLWWRLRRDAS